MGETSGIDVFHQLRADKSMWTVPVIFFTGTERRVTDRLPDYQARGAALVIKPDFERLGALAQELASRSVFSSPRGIL